MEQGQAMKKRPYHGTCLVNGNHVPGSETWKECPLRMADKRSERSRKAARTRWGVPGDPPEHQGGVGHGGDAQGA